MGRADLEAFRCRVYGSPDTDEEQRRAFVDALAKDGVIECPAYDSWLGALEERGWIEGVLEPNPNGPGYVKRWTLTEGGLVFWTKIKGP